MFFLICFVLGKDYCIETTSGRCQNICKNKPEKFEKTFSYIPKDNELNTNNNDEIHTFYIADDVPYFDSIHNFIFCDPSIHLIYDKPISTIRVKEHIIIDSDDILRDAPILFKINNSLIIEIDTEEKKDSVQVILESVRFNYLLTKFYVERFPENLILISSDSHLMAVDDKTDYLLKAYNDTEKLVLSHEFQYYCISDKENKCADYNIPTMNYVNSVSDILDLSVYLIIDTSVPQNLYNLIGYYHVVALKGSEIIYDIGWGYENYEKYVILHSKTIEMNDILFEGEGNVTLQLESNISILSTTKKCNINFSIKTYYYYSLDDSVIYPIKDDFLINMDKKIYIKDFSLFRGPAYLKGMFEPDRYLIRDVDFINDNLTSDLLKEYDYIHMQYYFRPGIHEIPVSWKKSCRFHGMKPNETTFIFNDVHSFDGYRVDGFIDCNMYDGSLLNSFIIKPSHHFQCDLENTYGINLQILIDNDIYMYIPLPYSINDLDYYKNEYCKIIGNGNIYVDDQIKIDVINSICQIEGNINLIIKNVEAPSVYACVGQSDLDKCKAEIPDIDSLQNYEWIWARNLITTTVLNEFLKLEKSYLTDKHDFTYETYYGISKNFVMTAKADITIHHNYLPTPTIVQKNQIDSIVAVEKTAKLTYVFDYNNINLEYREEPTEIDFNIFILSRTANLFMKYTKKHTPNVIGLIGNCTLCVREYLLSCIDIFKIPETIVIEINNNTYYKQVLYSDELEENVNLTDFILCKNYDDFVYWCNYLITGSIYIYKDIQLDFQSSSTYYDIRDYYFYNGIKANLLITNTTQLIITDWLIHATPNQIGYLSYYFNSKDPKNTLIFHTKESIYIDIDKNSASYLNFPKIEFNGYKQLLEVFPNPSFKAFENKYQITLHENVTAVSSYPEYFSGIITSIEFSPKNSYLYISDEGKKFYEKNPFESFKINPDENDDNLMEDIVLAVGKDDVFSIPSKWTKNHKITLIQEDGELFISKPWSIEILPKGVVLNKQINIINGNIAIYVPNNFTYNVGYSHYRTLYYVRFITTDNDHIHIYSDFINPNYYPKTKFNWYNIKPKITFYTNDNSYHYIKDSFESIDIFEYNYYSPPVYINNICFSISNSDKCPEESLIITSNSDLDNIIKESNFRSIYLASDVSLNIHQEQSLYLYPLDENVKITLLNPITRASQYNDNTVYFSDEDWYINIKKPSQVFAKVKNSLYLGIDSNSIVSITLSLTSNAIFSSYRELNKNIPVTLIRNSYHIYSEHPEYFGNIFGEPLEPVVKKCACDIESSHYCSFNETILIDDLFNGVIDYHELQAILLLEPKEVKLPPISSQMKVDFLPKTSKELIIKDVSNINFTKYCVMVNEFWNFTNYRRNLILKLEKYSNLEINDRKIEQVILQLTDYESYINLTNSTETFIPVIMILNHGDRTNKLIVFGSLENFEKFVNSIFSHYGVKIIFNGTEKYHYCICNNDKSCEKCISTAVEVINSTNIITNDPGLNVDISIFSDIEISSNIFKYEHDVLIDESSTVYIKDVKTVNQNLMEGIQIDKLTFNNAKKIILKPGQTVLNIIMKKNEAGPDFYIEVDKYLKLDVINIDEENVKASNIYVSGSGELYANNYPIDKIINVYFVKIYVGVYIICNNNSSQCNNDWKYAHILLGIFSNFENILNSNAKIIVFLSSFVNNIDVNLNNLNGQKIEFDRSLSSAHHLLEEQNKLRFTTTTELISKADSTTKLSSQNGGALLDNSDSDLFIVGFDSHLTIKQEGNITSNINQITIQPMNDDVTIFVDDSVDLKKQKIKIEPEENNEEKEIKVKVVINKDKNDDELIKNFIENGDNKVKVTFENSSSPNSKKKFPIGAIIGIVIGVVVIVAIIIIVIMLVLKKKNTNNEPLSNDSESQIDDSTF